MLTPAPEVSILGTLLVHFATKKRHKNTNYHNWDKSITYCFNGCYYLLRVVVICMIRRVNLLSLLLYWKPEPAGFVPPDDILLPGSKRMQKCLLLAEGISFASFQRNPVTTEFNKPARYRGPSLQCDLPGKSLKAMTTVATLHKRRGSQEPRVLRGKCRHFVGQSWLSWGCRPDEPDMPSAALAVFCLLF